MTEREEMIRKHHERLDELVERARKEMHEIMDAAINSGAVGDDYIMGDNYLLSKAIVTVFCKREPFAPTTTEYKRNIENIHRMI